MIGKTRQQGTKALERQCSESGPRPCILNPSPALPAFRLSHRNAAAELTRFIEHYWLVAWDLRNREPHTQETLPHPNVHVVFEKNNSHVFGVVTGKFSRLLKGKSHVFGIRFAPAMFRPFLRGKVAQLTDRTRPVRDIFGDEVIALEHILASEQSEEELVSAANSFLKLRVPEPDEKADLANELVQQALKQRDLLTVDHLSHRSGVSKRNIERLFSEYVGVGPKWVLRRYRLQEAVEKIRSGENVDCAELAIALGYFDPAHLINDFRSIVGYTPTEFRKLYF